MGNCKNKLLTPGSLKQAERELLEFSGLSQEEYEVKKVFTDAEETQYMTTILAGDPSKPPLVLVHGFGGSGSLYYKVMKGLSEHFHLIVIDLIGMGSSSRPAWTCRNGSEADEFFMNAVETWRINMGNLTNFFIAAHSYGGYIFGSYAAAYPQHVRKLLLLSPLGVKQRPEDFDLSRMRFMRGNGPPKWAVMIATSLWGNFSPFSVLKFRSERKVREMLGSYIDRHQPVDDPREKAVLGEYLFQILLRDSSTSIALFQQHDPGLHAYAPLAAPSRLNNPEIPFPISFIYGENDWMDSRGSRDIVRTNRHFLTGESQLHILPNAGHQLFMGNPQGFVKLIIDDLCNRKTGCFQIKRYTVNYVDQEGNLTFPDTEWEQLEAAMQNQTNEGGPQERQDTEESKEMGPSIPRSGQPQLRKQPTVWDTIEQTDARRSGPVIEPQEQMRIAEGFSSGDVEGADPFQ